MQKTLHYLIVFLLVSCSTAEKKPSMVYFGGEIVNPSSDHVILYKGDMTLDTARLDENNRFFFHLDSVDEGLHHFYHYPEEQYVYLERGDSLQIRLNTVDFDESLAFSGTNEQVNNFLVELFLASEQEEELVYSLYGLEPKEFVYKIDSLKNLKLDALNSLSEEYELSANALEIARSGIMYNSYIAKEAYPFYHKKKKGEKAMHELPADYYNYRSEVSYDNSRLTYYRPYYNYMKYHLGNLSYMDCEKGCNTGKKMVKNHLHFNQHKLKLIDSLIKENELRDNLFRNVAMDYLLKYDTEENIEIFIKEFHQLSGNNRHIHEINNLYDGIRNLQPQKELPELIVSDFEGNQVSIKDLGKDRKVVFYFWSAPEKRHFSNMIKRIDLLKENYPDYSFIGLNVRTEHSRWNNMLEQAQLDKSEQYWTENFDDVAHTLIVYDPNRGIITNNGIIVDAFANVYTSFKVE
ncbi:transaldolase [uncultured Eudoraea sp.]|uniref:TlpA family protein disulfide reductase n=1 Tax=uncultured Eudoraea sp. TaxID=1035614 RepID=UPI0026019DAA|nr:transaldolase [uncultured Eudoraea sp.]